MDAALILAAAVLVASLAWWLQGRHRDRVRNARATMWDRCLDLLLQPRLFQDDINFPVLEGTYRGSPVRLEPIADHMAYRKLPQLWLSATVHVQLPFSGKLDYLVRPENTEFYSPIWSLPVSIPIPANWPQHALLRTDCVDDMPPLETVSPHMAIFESNRIKELFITSRGARIVYQLDQGQRAYYSVFRSLRFENLVVDPLTLASILDCLLSLVADIEAAAPLSSLSPQHRHQDLAI